MNSDHVEKMREIVLRATAEPISALVVGDIMLDVYISGSVDRISPEAPVPVLKKVHTTTKLGGAGNVAANLASVGSNVTLLCLVSADSEAERLRELVSRYRGVRLLAVSTDRATTTKTRVVSGRQQLVRLDEEETAQLTDEELRDATSQISSMDLASFDVIVMSDYSKGFCSEDLCQALLAAARSVGVPVVVDPKGTDWSKYQGATIVTPNLSELSAAVGRAVTNDDKSVAEAADYLLREYALGHLLVTRSEKGMTLVTDDSSEHIASVAREVFDVTGAGDTAVAILARFLAMGVDPAMASAIANVAAGNTVAHLGTHVISFDELLGELNSEEPSVDDRIFQSAEEIGPLVRRLKEMRRAIVFTNGCFDILHEGHARLLNQARNLGDCLIVGLNSDASVRRLKGESRPVNGQRSRARVLASLRAVDYVVLFEEDAPTDLVRLIRPDVMVKGGDWKVEQIAGHEYAKRTVLIDLVPGFSTTNTIARARS